MDLSIKLENTTLYIRVAALVKGNNGYLFEKHKDGYIFAVGGKIMLNESSEQAIKRELKEELDFDTDNFKLLSVIENFYIKETGEKVHEICFVYEVEEVFVEVVPSEFVEVDLGDIKNHNIKPTQLIDLIFNEKKVFRHIVLK